MTVYIKYYVRLVVAGRSRPVHVRSNATATVESCELLIAWRHHDTRMHGNKKNCLYFGFFFTLSNQKRVCVCFYFHFINDIVLYTVGMCRFRLCIEYPYKTNRHSTTKCYVFKCLLMVCSRCIAPIVCREFYKYFYQINNIVNFVNLFLSLRWLVCAVHSSHNNLYTQHASCLICV